MAQSYNCNPYRGMTPTLPGREDGNTCVLLVVDLFSRHAEGYATTKKEEKTARGCASRIVDDDYIPRWGCPHTFLSD